jgi:aryl-alcohol dehydrogenase-like predicted oxidoreductase
MYTWEFARLQYTAKFNGWTTFISMQPFYNLLCREEEREMIPFCNEPGVGIIPWSPIARGMLARPRQKQDEEKSTRAQSDTRTEQWFADANLEIVDTVEKVAEERGVPMAVVATAWVLSRGCSPILGLSSEKRVEEGVKALELKLTDEEIKLLEEGYRPRRVEGM